MIFGVNFLKGFFENQNKSILTPTFVHSYLFCAFNGSDMFKFKTRKYLNFAREIHLINFSFLTLFWRQIKEKNF